MKLLPMTDQEKLRLVELLVKAGAGYRNSHTEEQFLEKHEMMNKDRRPNKKGRKFLCDMLYSHSDLRPPIFYLMREYRL